MRVKVQGGTARVGEPSLCVSFRNATIVRGHKIDEEIVECSCLNWRSGRVTFDVSYCTDYRPRNEPTLREMEEMAFVLRTDGMTRKIGFVRARTLKDEERFKLSDQEW